MVAATGGNPQWTSRFAFLMAAIGSAVGLGNLWGFPFRTGQNGGSAFVLVYLLCVVFIAYPILMSELMVGRHKGLSAIESTSQLAKDAGRSTNWGIVGIVGVVGAFLLLTTYSVIAGQVMAFGVMSVSGGFSGGATAGFYDGTLMPLMWHTVFMAMTIFVVAQGLHNGIERFVTILMPAFFFMLAGLCIYSLSTGASGQALSYLFSPRFHEVTPAVVLAAMGQAFFSLSLGCATMITYGTFLSREENIAQSGGVIAGADTLVAIVSGLMIFPIVFAFDLDPAQGFGLMFSAMPAVFSEMPGGAFLGGVFFVLALVAALTSAISLLIVAAIAGQNYTKLGKAGSAIVFGGLVWLVGASTIFISGLGANIDFIANSISLPLGGLLVAILVGWVAPSAAMRGELPNSSDRLFQVWRFLVRYVAPIAIIITLILGLDQRFGFGLNAALSSLAG